MSNQFIASFSELLAAQNEALGSTISFSCGGVTVQCVQEFPSTNQSLQADAFSEDGTTWIQCLSAPFVNNPITFQAPCIVDGKNLQIYNMPADNHGVYRFQVADPTRK